MRPNFETPVDTINDVVEQNLTLLVKPSVEFTARRILTMLEAEKIHVSKDDDEYFLDAKYKILGNGTHVIIDGALSPLKIMYLDARFGEIPACGCKAVKIETGFGTWYRSKERLDGFYPFAGPITTKNWYGNEVGKDFKSVKLSSCDSSSRKANVSLSVTTNFLGV